MYRAYTVNCYDIKSFFPRELTHGLLTPLQKPGKQKGPPANLRPIIILSILRKLLTICLLRRAWDRIKEKIPVNQAAYQPGRSTTEQVFAIKILCEKAIASNNYQVHLLLLDMSKAFDMVLRDKLLESLEKILYPDEIHLLSILTNRPTLQVKLENNLGREFSTYLGIMQGDSLSAILFIFYLAECLNEKNDFTQELKNEPTENDNTFNVDPFYADDTTFASTQEDGLRRLERIQNNIPQQLKKYNLQTNATKTEKYSIPRPEPEEVIPTYEDLEKHKEDKCLWSEFDYLVNYHPKQENNNPNWKKCKLLGSNLDSEEDIKRRKIMSMGTMEKLSISFKSSKISLQCKIKLFTSYVHPIMLYNCELWTISSKIEKSIDSYQRRLLRKLLKIKWPKNISNDKLYQITKTEKWSITIKRRRLKWLGHLLRLPEQTPAQRSLQEALKETPKKVGRPITNWLQNIKTDILTLNIAEINKEDSIQIIIEKIKKYALDREAYKKIVDCCIPKVKVSGSLQPETVF